MAGKTDYKNNLCFLKLGGSIITDVDKPDTPNIEAIRRLSIELKESLSDGMKLIVGHGSGSFAHVPAHRYQTHMGRINEDSMKGAVITHHAARRLNEIVMENMIEIGIDALSFSPSSAAMAEDKKVISWNTDPIEKALGFGFVPIIYGDVLVDLKQGFCIASTEELFRALALKLRPKRIIIGTDVDGVFDSDPKQNKNAKLIRSIGKEELEYLLPRTTSSRKFNVTGSMNSKIQLLYETSENTGAECQILNAAADGRIRDALKGKHVESTIIKSLA